VSSWDE